MNIIADLCEPTLLLDEARCRNNIKQMVKKARQSKVLFRPHFKTHQSHEIGRWFRQEGVKAITVSSLKMASFFAEDGWKDITVAIPVNTREKHRINDLAKKVNLHLLVADITSILNLDKIVDHPINVWIKIDTGYHRTGLLHDDDVMIKFIVNLIEKSK